MDHTRIVELYRYATEMTLKALRGDTPIMTAAQMREAAKEARDLAKSLEKL